MKASLLLSLFNGVILCANIFFAWKTGQNLRKMRQINTDFVQRLRQPYGHSAAGEGCRAEHTKENQPK